MRIMSIFRWRFHPPSPSQMPSRNSKVLRAWHFAKNSNSSETCILRRTASGASGISCPQWDSTRHRSRNILSGRTRKNRSPRPPLCFEQSSFARTRAHGNPKRSPALKHGEWVTFPTPLFLPAPPERSAGAKRRRGQGFFAKIGSSFVVNILTIKLFLLLEISRVAQTKSKTKMAQAQKISLGCGAKGNFFEKSVLLFFSFFDRFNISLNSIRYHTSSVCIPSIW